jgi:ribosomal-protein-alanine N-acetyltransferase
MGKCEREGRFERQEKGMTSVPSGERTVTVLQSERLQLRPFREEDLDDLAALLADAEVMPFLADGKPLTREESQVRLERAMDHWQQHGFGLFALFDRGDGRFVGRCGLGYFHDVGDVELSYAVARPYWGRGLATEAVQRVLRYAFEELNLPRVVAAALVENVASQRVMARAGMTFSRDLMFDGYRAVLYAIDNPRTD